MTTLEALMWTGIAMLAAAFSTAIYALYVYRLAILVQPLRLKMADLSRELLARDLSSEDRGVINWMVQKTFSPMPAFVLAFLLPLWPLMLVFGLGYKYKYENVERPPTPGVEKLVFYFIVSAIASNPIAGFIVIVEFLFVGMFAFIIGGHKVVFKLFMRSVRAEAALRPRRLGAIA